MQDGGPQGSHKNHTTGGCYTWGSKVKTFTTNFIVEPVWKVTMKWWTNRKTRSLSIINSQLIRTVWRQSSLQLSKQRARFGPEPLTHRSLAEDLPRRFGGQNPAAAQTRRLWGGGGQGQAVRLADRSLSITSGKAAHRVLFAQMNVAHLVAQTVFVPDRERGARGQHPDGKIKIKPRKRNKS